MNPLAQTAIDLSPFLRRNDPGNDVERKDFLGAGFIAVNIKRNAHAEESLLSGLLVAAEFGVSNRSNSLEEQARVRPRRAVAVENFVVESLCRFSVKQLKKSVRSLNAPGRRCPVRDVRDRLELNPRRGQAFRPPA